MDIKIKKTYNNSQIINKIKDLSSILEVRNAYKKADRASELIEEIKEKLCHKELEIIEQSNIAAKLDTLLDRLKRIPPCMTPNFNKGSKSSPTIDILIYNLNLILSKVQQISEEENDYNTDYYYLYKNDNKEYKSYNSTEFYNKKINEINKEKQDLSLEVDAIKNKLLSAKGEKEAISKELENKEKELNESIRLIKQFEIEKSENEKINDAKIEWNKKISDAFDELKKYIQPIRDEHKRLNKLFWAYSILSIITFISVFIIEIILCCKIESNERLLTWNNYIPLIFPIPVAIGGLWGFITLMHKVQRQMVILAKYIYEIEYVEGLLITKNNLSTNIDESMNKVNEAIEKLLGNHLNNNNIITEELSLEKEEKKDTMPYEEVIKLIKGVTGIVNGK